MHMCINLLITYSVMKNQRILQGNAPFSSYYKPAEQTFYTTNTLQKLTAEYFTKLDRHIHSWKSPTCTCQYPSIWFNHI